MKYRTGSRMLVITHLHHCLLWYSHLPADYGGLHDNYVAAETAHARELA